MITSIFWDNKFLTIVVGATFYKLDVNVGLLL